MEQILKALLDFIIYNELEYDINEEEFTIYFNYDLTTSIYELLCINLDYEINCKMISALQYSTNIYELFDFLGAQSIDEVIFYLNENKE